MMPAIAPGGRKRLRRGTAERRGRKTGFSVPGAMLFGLPFVGAGIMIMLVGQRVVAVDPASVHAPWWVLTVAGLCFAAGGLTVWGMGATQWKAERHRRVAMERFAGSPAHADYPWDPAGDASREIGRAVRAVLTSTFVTVFLSMFHWWAFVEGGPIMVKIIVGVFDLVLVLVWWQTVVVVGRAFKFGGSRVRFEHFPYRVQETIALSWVPPRGMGNVTRGEFTLRCVKESYQRTGSGKNSSKSLMHEELCIETQSFDNPQSFAPGRDVHFRFSLPGDARATNLSGDRPVFWEFEVKLVLPGFDFEERYLVPIYA
jgi:hypothetical protein